MTPILNILNELKGVCLTVDPDLKVYSSYDQMQSDLLDNLINEGQVFWVLGAGHETFDAGWSTDTPTYRCPASVYLVGPERVMQDNNQNWIADRLEGVRNTVRNGTFTTFQQIEPATVDTRVTGEVLAILLSRAVTNLLGGCCYWDPGLIYVIEQ